MQVVLFHNQINYILNIYRVISSHMQYVYIMQLYSQKPVYSIWLYK